jgi:DNA processing protein
MCRRVNRPLVAFIQPIRRSRVRRFTNCRRLLSSLVAIVDAPGAYNKRCVEVAPRRSCGGAAFSFEAPGRFAAGAVMSTLIDCIALSLTPLRWRRDLGDKLRSGEQPGQLLESLADLYPPEERLGRLASLQRRSAAAVARSTVASIEGIAWTDERYPLQLAAIYDPPPVVWMRGNSAVLAMPAVAIVGSRAGSPYALAVAERLAADLAARGVLVVSGLARGVDSAAHRGALATGRTVAVLGSGVDVIYPREHVALANQIAERGGLVSELVPGTPPHPRFFPWRNRIISGLSRAVVVVEAGEKSGSLITARCALEQGRDVLAVPGGILSGRNRGGHALLKDGARIVESADDILDELGVGVNPDRGVATSEAGRKGDPNRAVDPVLACLEPGESTDLETISGRCGLSVPRLLPRLFELEMSGAVRRAGGGRFIRA